jgi:hypothetical protein
MGDLTPDAESIDFRPVGAEHRVARPLGVDWIHGSVSAKHNTDPDIQVHWYDEHTVILRQNMAQHPAQAPWPNSVDIPAWRSVPHDHRGRTRP